MFSGERNLVLDGLFARCGFKFEENDLSPLLRQEITNLAQKLGEIAPLRRRVSDLAVGEARERRTFFRTELFGGLLLVLGLLVLFGAPALGGVIVIFGFLSVLYAFYAVKPRYTRLGTMQVQAKSEADWLQTQLEEKMDSLAKSIVGELSELHEQKLHPKQVNLNVNVDLDFKGLRDEMDKGGLMLAAVKCPRCGAGLDLPQTGSLIRCEYCGATIHAADFFDQLKGLLK